MLHRTCFLKLEWISSSTTFPLVSQDHIELMEGNFTEGEIKPADKILNPLKTPDPEGHYYKKYSALLTPHLCFFFNELGKEARLAIHENAIFIHVILKPGKDLGDCSNCYPISLINVDLKLITKILATRMDTVLFRYIHPDHVGFVPNHQAPNQTRCLINIIAALHSNWDNHGKRKGLLLLLDLCKAFDSISWEYMFYVLKRYGFGPNFLTILQTLYSTPTDRFLVKGYS